MSTNGYKTKDFGVPVKRYCQTMRLKDDAELIRKYREAHDKEHFWDEIKQGIKAVGILEMEIYILGNTLFMIVDAPLDFDWDSASRNGKIMWLRSRTAPRAPRRTRSGR